jgi:uncharacterized membrane protein
MIEKIRIAHLLVTLVLAAQGMFYLVGPAAALKTISVSAFAEQRVAIDNKIAGNLRILYYSALLLGILVLLMSWKQYDSLPFICTALALLFTITDIVLAMKFNLPINETFKSYPDAPAMWKALQLEWIKFIVIRGVLAISAMLSLLLTWFWR